MCFASFDAFRNGKYFSAVLFFTFALIALWYCWFLIHSKIRETEKIINSVYKKDFSLFPKTENNNDLKNSAVKLYYQAKEENNQLYSYKNLYDAILNKLEIGFVILNKKEGSENWKVFYCNPAFMNILKVPKYNEWNFYEEKIPDFYRMIENTEYQDSQDFMEISIKESSRQSFSIRTSGISAYQNDYCIISLESIQKIIDKKEKQAWNNLMKVISHELLNTLTPINSLIQNIEYLSEEENLTKEDQKDIKDSLKIINSKSEQLLHFIDSYRQVAELPKPKKQYFDLKNCVRNVLNLLQPQFHQNKIEIFTNLKNTSVFADQKMIERVLINLLTNAVQALKSSLSDEKEINIEIIEFNKRVSVLISDNGEGVDSTITDKIFLPFFTTKPQGSGIGLTLAKSIMEAHNGYLTYKRTGNLSSFEVLFV